jgi:Winged helix DNA-binding domain
VTFSDDDRRARLVTRHRLDGSATTPLQAVESVFVLHATDPATVYLSVLARCATATLADVAAMMYDERETVRMLAMRRTLFVVPQADVPVVHHAASLGVAANQRRVLLRNLEIYDLDPDIAGDHEEWLDDVMASVERACAARGVATAMQLTKDEPRLATALVPSSGKKWDVRRAVGSSILTLMAVEGRLVRGRPRGAWTSRAHTWEAADAWWPDGIPEPSQAPARLVEAYLRRFGPATERDVAWWTGWTLGATRKAIAGLDTEDVGCGLVLAGDTAREESMSGAALLPALDPTPMGWKERDWFLPGEWQSLYDSNGNIGPTIWWQGRVVGGWAVSPEGRVVARLLEDVGAEGRHAVDGAVEELQPRLEGATVRASFPTPLERELRG